MAHLSNQTLREELRHLAGRLQRIPNMVDMNTFEQYSTQTYLDRFGTWENALEVTNLTCLREPNLSLNQLSTDLERLGEQLNRTPTHVDLRNHSEFSPWVYIDRFHSWRAALERARFDTTSRTDPAVETVSHGELRKALTELANTIGCTPSQDEVDKYGDYASDLYCIAFGTCNDALNLASLSTNPQKGAPTYSTTELLSHLRELTAELGQPPSAQVMNTKGEFTAGTYRHQFGSWNQALFEAGIPQTTIETLPSAKALLTEVHLLYEDLERPPAPAQMRQQAPILRRHILSILNFGIIRLRK